MVKIILEDWQVKNLREYFGHNDKTQTSHWAYDVFNKAYKEQCNIPIVVKPLNFNINKDLKIKSLGDLKRAYPDNHSHRVSSFGGCINYFVDGQLVYERKI